ncbi:MAG: hypothetical protein QGI83_17005, partial [Candidatus Latescibacteria bacterium]|nr:hypothetical protein [Candidatus Latescibacterota bacterium]
MTRTDTGLIRAVALILVFGWTCGDPADAPGAENLALGKPYTLNGLPSKKWESLVVKKTGAIPDHSRILTDGEIRETPYFWSSEKCVSMFEDPAEVTIDLGAVHPIGEITTRHGSRAPMVLQPRREVYFVSDDAVTFRKVGAFVNPEDPVEWDGTEAALKSHYSGVMKFSSGPIRAKGRYVMVRTYPPGRGRYAGYVGYDEIAVVKGDFEPDAAEEDTGEVYVVDPGGFEDERVLGYRFLPRDWVVV